VIVCPRCSKENQDHYKFCLGCGAELPRDAAKKEFVAPVTTTDPPPRADRNLQFAATQQGDATALQAAASALFSNPPPQPAAAAPAPIAAPAPRPAPIAAPAPAAVAAPAPGAGHNCPACGNPVPPDFKFCGTCGHRLTPGGSAAGAASPAAAPAAAAAHAPAVSGGKRGKLVLINPDGSEGATYTLESSPSVVGRSKGAPFAMDAYLSPSHATFTFGPEGCTVRDEASLNGVYVKVARDTPVRLQNGDVFRIGQEIIRFEAQPVTERTDGVEPMGSPDPGYLGRICLVTGRQSIGNSHPIPPDGLHIGRERGDVIFPEDGYVSGLHCRLHHDGSSIVLTDVGSSNGTFVRVRGERVVQSGELLLLGQQLFRLQF
jgi:pSer/pThr/pTyr-binding forkhead associated (FHA) protein